MTQITQGAHVYLFPEPGQVYRVQADDVATVQVLYGAPSAVITLTAESRTFGPYDSPAKLKVTANTAAAEYTLLRAHYAELTQAQIDGGAVGALASNNAGGVIEPDGDVPTLGGGSVTLPAMQTAYDAGSAAEKSAFQASVSGGGIFGLPVRLSTTDAAANTAAIIAAATAGHSIILPHGSYPITPIAQTGDLTICGQGQTLTILTSQADTAGWMIQATGKLDIRHVGILGAAGDTPKNLQSVTGNQSGILLRSDNQSQAICVSVRAMGHIGIGLSGDTTATRNGATVAGCHLTHNKIGLHTGASPTAGVTTNVTGEYCKITGNTILENQTGYYVGSGNNSFTGNSVSFNWDGVVIDGTVANAAHGNITGNSINHSSNYSIRAFDVQYGHIITSNSLFYGSIKLDNCSGIIVANNGINAWTVDIPTSARHSEVRDNVFFSTPILVGMAANSLEVFKDNWDTTTSAFIGGKSLAVDPSIYISIGSIGPQLATPIATPAWTLNSGWAISGGVLTGSATSGFAYAACPATDGKTYRMTANIAVTSGSLSIGIGGNGWGVTGYVVSGTGLVIDFVAHGSNNTLYFGGSSFTGTISNVTVYELATESTLGANNIKCAHVLTLGNTIMYSGTGSPEGVLAAAKGSEYTREDGTAGTYASPGTLKYIKTSGTSNTGWVAVL